MTDITEAFRREAVIDIASRVQSMDPTIEKARLEKEWGAGNVWDTRELGEKFEVIGFMAPFTVVREKSTGKKGTVEFQHCPRFYYGWMEGDV